VSARLTLCLARLNASERACSFVLEALAIEVQGCGQMARLSRWQAVSHNRGHVFIRLQPVLVNVLNPLVDLSVAKMRAREYLAGQTILAGP